MPLPRRAFTTVLAVCALTIGALSCSTTEPVATGGDQSGDAGSRAAGQSSGEPAGPGSSAATATSAPDPGTLPQTEDRPASSGPMLDQQVEDLWQAIVTDDPELALGFFFPLGAYEQVKDMSDPKADYDSRLIPQFEGDIHAYHQRLGADAESAELIGLEVADYNTQWINPGIEYNQIGYWRALDSTLRYEVDGTERTLNVKSMISWRGEWYIVHLVAIV